MRDESRATGDALNPWWALVFEHSDQLVFAVDTHRRILAVSDGFRERSGLSVDELIGHVCAEVAHHGGEVPAECPLQDLMSDGRQHTSPVHSDPLGGDFLVHVLPVADESGRPAVIVHTLIDVTDSRQAEAALAESEERFRGYFEQSVIGVAVTSPDKGWIEVNQAVCDLLGYDREELGRRTWEELTHPDDLDADVAQFECMMAGDIDGYRLTKRFIRADGETVHVDLGVRCRRRDDGSLDYVLALLSDITGQVHLADELDDERQRFKLLVDNSNDAVLLAHPDGTIHSANPAACAMFGRTEEELQTTGRAGIVDASDPRLKSALDELIRDEGFAGELRFVRADGGTFPGEVSSNLYIDHAGRQRASVVIRDLTERRAAELALRESERRFASFAAYMPGRLWIRDAELRYLYLNAQLATDLGGNADDFLGKTPEELWDAKTAAGTRELCRRALEGEIVDFVERWPDEPGSSFFRSLVFAIHTEGEPSMLGGLMFDVTEQRRASEEIRRLNSSLEDLVSARTAELEAVNEELSAFAYSVSHDLRAPLRAIDGFTQIVLEDAGQRLDERDVAHLQRARTAAQRMATLIDDLLRLSRASRERLTLEAVSVTALAESVAEELREAEPERSVEVVIAPEMRATADPTLLRMILFNLIGNAWKFTARRSTGHIEVGLVRQDGEPVFFVRDDGAGFDMRYAKSLFGAFQRIHRQEEFEGNGIGLATVQRLVTAHAGRVWAESEPDRGATFFFTLAPGELQTAPA
jgi:PAS domain S-box-containing protein